jgi:hypothetical protein
MDYFLTTLEGHQGPGVARVLTIPAAGLQFVAGAENISQSDALLKTVRPLAGDQTTVAVAISRASGQYVLTSASGHHLQSRTIQAETQDPTYERPGQLIRTVPPVGTPVDDGSVVKIFVSAGDLGAVVSPNALTAAGWEVKGATDVSPSVSADRAHHEVSHPAGASGAPANYGEFLRSLNGNLVWIVALGTPAGSEVQLTAVDATTGRILQTHTFARSGT